MEDWEYQPLLPLGVEYLNSIRWHWTHSCVLYMLYWKDMIGQIPLQSLRILVGGGMRQVKCQRTSDFALDFPPPQRPRPPLFACEERLIALCVQSPENVDFFNWTVGNYKLLLQCVPLLYLYILLTNETQPMRQLHCMSIKYSLDLEEATITCCYFVVLLRAAIVCEEV